MASPPVFEEHFTVDAPEVQTDHPNWAKYRKFIDKLRNRLRDDGNFSHGIPVLPQRNTPREWFHIILQTEASGSRITLRIRRDNLYLDGYQMENSQQWLEFGTTNSQASHLIPGSTFLGFSGSYDDLEKAARQSRRDITLGQEQLTTAVENLATSIESSTRAKSLIIVIQMISESIRFKSICDHIARTFSGVLPSEMQERVNSWGDLSNALWMRDANHEHQSRLLQGKRMNIVTVEEVVKAVGMLLAGRPSGPGTQGRPLVEVGIQGRPLVEVFSVVRENNTDGKLYGIITVTDAVGSQDIYNKERDEGDSGLAALLNGPAGCISASGSFIIDVDLMDDIKGQISWNVYDITNVYDTLLRENVNGERGSVTVNYAVFSDAVQATVEVLLVNGDGNDPAYVYGQITARNSNIANESTLFQKTSDENKQVSPGEPIPLSRSVVAVPLNSSLIVGANLFVKGESEREIATATAEFPAKSSGTLEKDISGKYGSIRVRVTWTVYI